MGGAVTPDDRDGPAPLPNSLELEQALLGAILVNNDAYHVVAGFLFPRHFFEPLHQSVYKAMALNIGRGQKITPATLIASMGPVPEKTVGGSDFNFRAYVAALAANAVTVMNAGDFGRRILDMAAEREIVSIAHNMVEGTRAGGAAQVGEQIEAAEAALSKVRSMVQAGHRGGAVSISEGVQLVIDRAEAVKAGQHTLPTTGFETMNKRFAGGYAPGRLIIVGGRPGMGKTVFMSETSRRLVTRSALSQREDERFAAAFVTLEVDVEELSSRIVAGDLYDPPHRSIPYRDVMSGLEGMEESDRERWLAEIRHRRTRMEKLPIFIDHAPGASITEIAGRVKLIKERARRGGYKLGLVAIDYLGLMAMTERYRGNRVAELGEAVLSTKRMAEDEEVCVLLGAQLNRQVENRDDKRPTVSDLRESGNIEEHADAIALLYREAHYLQKDQKKMMTTEGAERMALVRNRLDVIVDKNRMGPTGTDYLYIDVSCSHVADADRHHHD